MRALITTLAVFFAVVMVGGKVLAVELNKRAAEASKAAYAQRAADRDTRLTEACAKGQTGVVLYYKGVDCTAN